MAEKKKSASGDWPEAVAVGLGTWSWLISLGCGVYSLLTGLWYVGALGGIYSLGLGFGYYGLSSSGVWMIIQGVGALVLTFIYVLKPFSAKCKAKDWEALIEDKVGGSFSKMWLMGILLVVFGYWGSAGVLIPAILITFFGPGKGRVFGGKK
jgi:hypothetical protein